MKHEVKIAQTDYSVLIFVPDPASTDGSGKTGLVAADLTVSGARVETDNDVTITDYTSSLNNLSALTDAHNDWGLKEVSSSLAPGLYRLDIADAIFASGAWSAVVYVQITTSAAAASPMEFVMVPDAPITGVNVSQINGAAAATPGASGGLLISGSNSGTTTLGALTVTGATTLTGNLALAAGMTITQSTSNGHGIVVTGNGTGAGIRAVAGATGHGVAIVGGGTSGNGVYITITDGDGISVNGRTYLAGFTVDGSTNLLDDVSITGGLDISGSFGIGGNALVSGTTTHTGNVSMAAGLTIAQSSSNTSALIVTGNGTGHGALFTSGSGATGSGIKSISASTDGNGIELIGTGGGSGFRSTKFTVSGATLFTSTFDINGAATLTGAVSFGSTFTVTGTTTLTLAANTITAASIAADAITDAKVASDVTIASVTGAVGSVTGLTASDVAAIKAKTDNLPAAPASTTNITAGTITTVTGNVGGNVTGSVGSVAAGGITASSLAADAITAAKVASDVSTEIATQVDTTLSGTHGGGSWESGGGGGLSGPNSITLTWHDGNGDPVPLVDFTVAGQGGDRANVSGVATFGLSDGTYTITSRITSGVVFPNLSLVVDGTETRTITGTAIVIPAPSANPAKGTIYGYIYTPDGSTLEGHIATGVLVGPGPYSGPYKTNAGVAVNNEVEDTSASDGLWELDLDANSGILPAGSKWRIHVAVTGFQRDLTVASGVSASADATIT
jgi:hypothetical protein